MRLKEISTEVISSSCQENGIIYHEVECLPYLILDDIVDIRLRLGSDSYHCPQFPLSLVPMLEFDLIIISKSNNHG